MTETSGTFTQLHSRLEHVKHLQAHYTIEHGEVTIHGFPLVPSTA
jgi:hypothetical protein